MTQLRERKSICLVCPLPNCVVDWQFALACRALLILKGFKAYQYQPGLSRLIFLCNAIVMNHALL